MKRLLFILLICVVSWCAAEDEPKKQCQDVSWKAIRNARKYEVAIQHKEEDGSWTPAETKETKTNSAKFWLSAGQYRMSVAAFNMLNKKESASDWVLFTVLSEMEPFVFDKSFDDDDSYRSKVLYLDNSESSAEKTVTIKGLNIFYPETSFMFKPLSDSQSGSGAFVRTTSHCPQVTCSVVKSDQEDNTVTLLFDGTKMYDGYYELCTENPGGYVHTLEVLVRVERTPVITCSDFDFSRRYGMRTVHLERSGRFFSDVQPAPVQTVSESAGAGKSGVVEVLKPFVVSGSDFASDMEFELIPDTSVEYPFATTIVREVVPSARVTIAESERTESKCIVYFDTNKLQTGFYRLAGKSRSVGTAEMPLLITVDAHASDAPSITRIKSDLDVKSNRLELYVTGTNLNTAFTYSMLSFCLVTGENVRLPLTVRNAKKDLTALTLAADASQIPSAGVYALRVENNGAVNSSYIEIHSDFSTEHILLTESEIDQAFLQPVDMTIDDKGEKWIHDLPMEADKWYTFFQDCGTDITRKVMDSGKYFTADKNSAQLPQAFMRNYGNVLGPYEWNFSLFGLSDTEQVMQKSDTIIFKLDSSRRRLYWRVSLRQEKDDVTSYYTAPLKVQSGTSIIEIPYTDFVYDSSRGGADVPFDPSCLAAVEFTKHCTSATAGGGDITVSEIKVYDSSKCKEFREEKTVEPKGANVLSLFAGVCNFDYGTVFGLRSAGFGLRIFDNKYVTADFSSLFTFTPFSYSFDVMAYYRKIIGMLELHAGLGAGLTIFDFTTTPQIYVPVAAGIQLFDLFDVTYRCSFTDVSGFVANGNDIHMSHTVSAGLALRVRRPWIEKAPLLSSGITGIQELMAPVVMPVFATSLFITSYTADVTDITKYTYGAVCRAIDLSWLAVDAGIKYDGAAAQMRIEGLIEFAVPSAYVSPHVGCGIGYAVSSSDAESSGMYVPFFCGITWFDLIYTRVSADVYDIATDDAVVNPMLGIGIKIKIRRPVRLQPKTYTNNGSGV